MPSKFKLFSWLFHLTFSTIPPKSILDLEPRIELYLSLSLVVDHHSVITPSLSDLSLRALSTNLPYHPQTLGVFLDWLSVASSAHWSSIPLWYVLNDYINSGQLDLKLRRSTQAEAKVLLWQSPTLRVPEASNPSLFHIRDFLPLPTLGWVVVGGNPVSGSCQV